MIWKRLRGLYPWFLVILPAILFWRVLLRGELLAEGDLVAQYIPWKSFYVEQLRKGIIPLWNPREFCGAPFWANMQVASVYPLDLLALITPLPVFYSVSAFTHLILAGLGTFMFARQRGLSKPSASIAGIALGASGTLVTKVCAGQIPILCAAAYFPWLMWLLERWLDQPNRRHLPGFAALLALQLSTGHPQVCYISIVGLLSYGFFRVATGLVCDRRAGFAILGKLLLSVLVASVLVAALILPAMELAQHSAGRAGGMPFTNADTDSMPWFQPVTFVAPFIFGNPVAESFWLAETGYWEICGFVGLTTLFLAVLGGARRRSIPLVGIAALALLLALGHRTPVFRLAFHLLPGFRYFRCPGRYLLLYAFAAAALGGEGMEHIIRWTRDGFPRWVRRAGMALVLLAIVLLLFMVGAEQSVKGVLLPRQAQEGPLAYLAESVINERYQMLLGGVSYLALVAGGFVLVLWWFQRLRRPNWSGLFLLSLLSLELLFFGLRFVKTKTAATYQQNCYPVTPAIRVLLDDPQRGRFLAGDSVLSWWRVPDQPDFLPNRTDLHGLESARGYDPIIVREYQEFVNLMQGLSPDRDSGAMLQIPFVSNCGAAFLQAAAIQYAVTLENLSQSPNWEALYVPEQVTGPDWPASVYRFKKALPPYRLVCEARVFPGKASVARAMTNVAFDPERVVCLTGLSVEEETCDQGPLAPDQTAGSLTVIEQNPNHVHLEVRVNRPCWLYAAQTFYPGWVAFVDGERRPVRRANLAFQAILLKPGDREVILSFEPATVRWGAWISLAAWVLFAAVLLTRKRKEKGTSRIVFP